MNNEFNSTKNKLYNYHPITGEFLNSSEAFIDPETSKRNGYDVYKLSSYSTFKEPPLCKDNYVAVFENDDWVTKSDYRGQVLYKPNGEKITITEIDVVFPDDSIFYAPPTDFIKPKFIDGEWKETAIIYRGIMVETKKDVDLVTSSLIKDLGEDKAKTEKLISGNNPSEIWFNFIQNREKLIQEGNDFISKYNLI